MSNSMCIVYALGLCVCCASGGALDLLVYMLMKHKMASIYTCVQSEDWDRNAHYESA